MIIGIGIDIVQVKRIKAAIDRYDARFMKRIFTAYEQDSCSHKSSKIDSLAARFAVKEATFKALGHGWDDCGGFTSVEIISDIENRPRVVLYGKAKKIAADLGVNGIYTSITHDAGISAAVVIMEK